MICKSCFLRRSKTNVYVCNDCQSQKPKNLCCRKLMSSFRNFILVIKWVIWQKTQKFKCLLVFLKLPSCWSVALLTNWFLPMINYMVSMCCESQACCFQLWLKSEHVYSLSLKDLVENACSCDPGHLLCSCFSKVWSLSHELDEVIITT